MKKTVSILICLAMILLTGLSVYAADSNQPTEPENYNGYPFILIRGMDFNGLRYKIGTVEEENAFKGVDASDIIKTLVKAGWFGIKNFSIESAFEPIYEYANDILGKMACNPDGSSKYDVSAKEYPLAVSNYKEIADFGDNNEDGLIKRAIEKYGAENVYYFNYDWRIDPFINASKVNDLIELAIRESGKEKVNILCASMGGIITLSYIYKYGYQRINRVIFDSSTFCGTYVTSDVLRGKIEINPYGLYRLLKLNSTNRLVENFWDILFKLKTFDTVSKLANKIVEKLKNNVYEEFLIDTFGTMPAVWALVHEENYDECLNYIFKGNTDKYGTLINLAQEYRKMNSERDKLLLKAEEDGVSICVVAGYDNPSVPVYPTGGCNGDTVLESAPMLGNAKVADLGKTLGDSYEAKDPSKLSPDRMVDLSSCLFPDSTWAIKGAPHVGGNYGSDYSDFLFSLVDADGKINVKSFEKYPQFMKSSNKEQHIELYQ